MWNRCLLGVLATVVAAILTVAIFMMRFARAEGAVPAVMTRPTTSQASVAATQFSADSLVGGWMTTNSEGVSSLSMLRSSGSWTMVQFTGVIAEPKSLAVQQSGGLWELISRPRGGVRRPMDEPLHRAMEAGETGSGWIVRFYPSNATAWDEIILRSTDKGLALFEFGRSAASITNYARLSAIELTTLEKALPSTTRPNP
jgi:hypothetical protein